MVWPRFPSKPRPHHSSVSATADRTAAGDCDRRAAARSPSAPTVGCRTAGGDAELAPTGAVDCFLKPGQIVVLRTDTAVLAVVTARQCGYDASSGGRSGIEPVTSSVSVKRPAHYFPIERNRSGRLTCSFPNLMARELCS